MSHDADYKAAGNAIINANAKGRRAKVEKLLSKYGVSTLSNLPLCKLSRFAEECENLAAEPLPTPEPPKPVFAIGDRVKRGAREGTVLGLELRYLVQRDGSRFAIPYKANHLERVEPKPAKPLYRRDFDTVYTETGRRLAVFTTWQDAEVVRDALNAYSAPK